jgi:transcriptional regulator with XRE-family HTH domain
VSSSIVAEPGQSSITDDSTSRTESINRLVGERVRLRRTSLNLTPQEISRSLRIDVSELAAHETGAKRMNANLLLRVSETLDVPIDYFFRDKADATNHPEVDGDNGRVKAA